MHTRLKEIIVEGDRAEKESWLIELQTMPERVHLLVGFDPRFGFHRLTKSIMGRSSRPLRREFAWLCSRLPTLGANSSFVATVGGDQTRCGRPAEPVTDAGR
jgi:putative transposase